MFWGCRFSESQLPFFETINCKKGKKEVFHFFQAPEIRGLSLVVAVVILYSSCCFRISPGGGGAVISQRDAGEEHGQKHCWCSHVGGGQYFNGSHGMWAVSVSRQHSVGITACLHKLHSVTSIFHMQEPDEFYEGITFEHFLKVSTQKTTLKYYIEWRDKIKSQPYHFQGWWLYQHYTFETV